MITLTAKWANHGITFPIGTVFIPAEEIWTGTIYSYGTPDGSHGQIIVRKGITPGD